MKRLLENLSRRQRQHTPLPFARYLISLALEMADSPRVAVLWTMPKTNYSALWPLADCWNEHRDARLYTGPFVVICHPPCGPWGKYKKNCHHRRSDGILAMQFVHRYGGVVEQPLGSSLFREHGQGGLVEKVNQGDFGHLCLKPTLLYIFPRPKVFLFDQPAVTS